jgi:hypothetical protein
MYASRRFKKHVLLSLHDKVFRIWAGMQKIRIENPVCYNFLPRGLDGNAFVVCLSHSAFFQSNFNWCNHITHPSSPEQEDYVAGVAGIDLPEITD